MSETTVKEITVKEVTLTEAKTIIHGWWRYLLGKWLWIGLIGIAFGVLGIFYAMSKKPIYTASLTFAADAESRGGMGAYAGLAAQFGMDLGGGGAFEGENLIVLLRSRKLIEKTFLTEVEINGTKQTMIDYLISTLKEDAEKIASAAETVKFSPDHKHGNRVRDSIMKNLFMGVSGSLNIDKIDRRLDIIQISLEHEDELFAKLFVENLANNAIQYYVDYRSKKATQNVAVLARQTDSVRSLISGGITAIAVTSDLNINPMKQVMRTGVQKRAVDVEVNKALYTQLVTNLQMARMSLREGTPFIQIIDTPILPLDKKKLGRAKAGIIFGFIGLFIAVLAFSIKRMF